MTTGNRFHAPIVLPVVRSTTPARTETILWRGKRLEDLTRAEVSQAFAEAWKQIASQPSTRRP